MPRRCRICCHKDLKEIDRHLQDNSLPVSAIALKYAPEEAQEPFSQALYRHRRSHLGKDLATIDPTQDRLTQLISLQYRCESLLEQAQRDNNGTLSAKLVKEHREILKAITKFNPVPASNSGNDLKEFQEAVIEALTDHPQAKQAVVTRLLQLS